MAIIKFTPALKRYFPHLSPFQVEGATIKDVLMNIDREYPGLKRYILDDQHQLRKHVNIFINGIMIKDGMGLSDLVHHQDEIFIIQALSGG